MSDSNPASGGPGRPRTWAGGRRVALLAGGVLVLAVVGIIVLAERRPAPTQPVGGPAIGTQTTTPGNTASLIPPSPAPSPAPSSSAPAAPPRSSVATSAPRIEEKPRASAGDSASAPEKPSFDVVHVGPEGGAVIAGRAAPDAEVTVTLGARELGHAKADDRGEWVLLPAKPLDPGPQELTLTSRGPRPDDRPVQAEASVVLTVPGVRTGQPGQTASLAQPALPALAVLTPENGAPRVLQAPPPEPGQMGPGQKLAAGQRSDKVGMDAVDYDENGNIRFGGAARPGSPVRVYVDNKPAGDARADAGGRWALAPDQAVAPGQHQLRVDQLDAKGKVISRVELPFQRVQLTAAEIGPGRMVVQPGQNLWRIARQTYGHGVHYTVIYRANLDQIRDPARIYPGQAFALPTSVGPELDANARAAVAAGSPAPSSSSRSR